MGNGILVGSGGGGAAEISGYDFSRRFSDFNEIGTYKIIAKHILFSTPLSAPQGRSPTRNFPEGFQVVSNPLFVSVVPGHQKPEDKLTNNAAKPRSP